MDSSFPRNWNSILIRNIGHLIIHSSSLLVGVGVYVHPSLKIAHQNHHVLTRLSMAGKNQHRHIISTKNRPSSLTIMVWEMNAHILETESMFCMRANWPMTNGRISRSRFYPRSMVRTSTWILRGPSKTGVILTLWFVVSVTRCWTSSMAKIEPSSILFSWRATPSAALVDCLKLNRAPTLALLLFISNHHQWRSMLGCTHCLDREMVLILSPAIHSCSSFSSPLTASSWVNL